MSRPDEITRHYQAAVELALAEVERRARKVMREHPAMVEFVMVMGGWSFKGRDGQSYCAEDKGYLQPLEDFISEWDQYLKLTGTPMRFTAIGPVRTQW